MLFNSAAFMIFLPIVFIVYWMLPHKYRWFFLLISSYYFYMSWNVNYIILIILTTGISYAAARLIENERSKAKQNLILIISITVCLGVLFFFKYFNFLSESVVALLRCFAIPVNPIVLKIILPVGISFYSFQTIGYIIDVYRGDIKAEHHFGVYATFISFFPQLVAGPIERSKNLLPQIKQKYSFDYERAVYGLKLMLWGYFKKLVIADAVAQYVDLVFAEPSLYGGADFLVAVFFIPFRNCVVSK